MDENWVGDLVDHLAERWAISLVGQMVGWLADTTVVQLDESLVASMAEKLETLLVD